MERDRLIFFMKAHARGMIAKHRAIVEIYLTKPSGIGEHSDIVETIELELEQVANYHDKLEMLVKYFIQPSTTEEETTDEKPRAKD